MVVVLLSANCHVCIFLLYFSDPPCLAPLQSCSMAGLPRREDGPFLSESETCHSVLQPSSENIFKPCPRHVRQEVRGTGSGNCCRQAGKRWVSSGRVLKPCAGPKCPVWTPVVGATDFIVAQENTSVGRRPSAVTASSLNPLPGLDKGSATGRSSRVEYDLHRGSPLSPTHLPSKENKKDSYSEGGSQSAEVRITRSLSIQD